MDDTASKLLQVWYDSFRGAAGREPDRYVICAGLAVLETARTSFPLSREDYVTPKNQVKKIGGPAIATILARYGESRTFLKEGGRTTRGTVPAADSLVSVLNNCTELLSASQSQLLSQIDGMQNWLAERAAHFFNLQRLQIEVDILRPASSIIEEILATAGSKAGAVAQHLVGAKLQLRFNGAGIVIENHSYTTADTQLGRPGDFTVRQAVFHVTMSPLPPVFEKCRENIRNGSRPYLLVPESKLIGARQQATGGEFGQQIGLHSSIETFIGQNIDELAEYDSEKFRLRLRDLFSEYNRRVTEAETDRSLLFEIPDFLQ